MLESDLFWRITESTNSEIHVNIFHPDGTEVNDDEFSELLEELVLDDESLIDKVSKHVTTMREQDKDVMILTTKEFFS